MKSKHKFYEESKEIDEMTALRHFLRSFGEAFTEFTTALTLSDDDYARGQFCSCSCDVQWSEVRKHADLSVCLGMSVQGGVYPGVFAQVVSAQGCLPACTGAGIPPVNRMTDRQV